MKKILVVFLLLVLAGNAFAATIYNQWSGGGGTSDWNTLANWNLGYVPFITDGTNVIKAGFKTATGPVITAATVPVPEADVITLGGGSAGVLTISSGTLNLGQYLTMGANVTESGTLYMNGGTINTGQRTTNAHLFVGQKGPGSTVYMNGGTINLVGGVGTTGNVRIADQAGSGGTLYLNAGTIYANNLLMPFAAAGSLAINGGTLVLNGNDESAVDALILAGKVTTAIEGYIVDAVYDGTNTTVSAVPEPATICLLGFGVLGLLSKKKK